MYLLDTHILIWWVNNSKELSSAARKAITTTLNNKQELFVSSISAWEIAMLVEKNRLALNTDVSSWIGQVSKIEGLRFLAVDNEIAIKSTMLPDNFHKDPADRMIVATARKMTVPLITADEKIISYEHVKTIF